MKIRFLILIIGLSIAGIFGMLYTVNMFQQIENQKTMEEWRELRTFVMSDLGKQKKCEEMGGLWNTDHCLITQETFDSKKLTCEPGPVLEDVTCQSNGIKLVLEPVAKSKNTEENNIPGQLKEIFGNCACQERVKSNPNTMERCIQPELVWENSTHYIDNNICVWKEK